MNPALGDLLAVQDLDLAADRLRFRREHLPESAQLGQLLARSGELQGELEQAKRKLDEVVRAQAEAEAELASCESRIKAVESRLFSGEVSAARELQAMSADADALRERASILEDRVLELLELREPAEGGLDALTGELESLSLQKSALETELAAGQRELDEEMSAVVAPRAEAAARVPPSLIATYERLRKRLGGIGVARLVGNHCDGCHLTLSAAELDEIRHLSDDEVPTCEQCSRILVASTS
jgi:uncharacterized protein